MLTAARACSRFPVTLASTTARAHLNRALGRGDCCKIQNLTARRGNTPRCMRPTRLHSFRHSVSATVDGAWRLPVHVSEAMVQQICCARWGGGTPPTACHLSAAQVAHQLWRRTHRWTVDRQITAPDIVAGAHCATSMFWTRFTTLFRSGPWSSKHKQPQAASATVASFGTSTMSSVPWVHALRHLYAAVRCDAREIPCVRLLAAGRGYWQRAGPAAAGRAGAQAPPRNGDRGGGDGGGAGRGAGAAADRATPRR